MTTQDSDFATQGSRVRAFHGMNMQRHMGRGSHHLHEFAVLLAQAGLDLDGQVADLGRPLGEELLEPTRIYCLDVLDLIRDPDVDVHAVSHVTGGGIAANLARVLPTDLALDVDRGTWRPSAIFDLIAATGTVARAEMERTFNQGIGMVAVVGADAADAALARLRARGVPAWVVGPVRARRAGEDGDAAAKGGGGGAVSLVGVHPG